MLTEKPISEKERKGNLKILIGIDKKIQKLIIKIDKMIKECNLREAQELLSKGMNELLHKGNYQKAITSFDRVIKLDKKNYRAFYGKGMALLFMNNLKEAEKYLEKVIKLHKTHAAAWSNLSGIQEKLGKKREVKKSQEMARLTNDAYEKEVERYNKEYEKKAARGIHK